MIDMRSWSRIWRVPAILAAGFALSCIIRYVRRGVVTFWWTPLAFEVFRLLMLIFFIFMLLRNRGADGEGNKVIDFAIVALLASSVLADLGMLAALGPDWGMKALNRWRCICLNRRCA